MTVTNAQSGTNVHEIAAGIYRISTPIPPEAMPGGFTFNQFLIADEEPLLFHTGLRRMFPLVREAVGHVLGDVAKLRWISFSHVEADECGALNDFLAVAPRAQPLCSVIGAMVSVNDLADRAPKPLADGEGLAIGAKRVKWLDAPNLPHNWECGYLLEETTKTLLCGDLFTQGGHDGPALTSDDLLPAARVLLQNGMAGMSRDAHARRILEKLAATRPATLATMHGPSFQGDGGKLLLALADELAA